MDLGFLLSRVHCGERCCCGRWSVSNLARAQIARTMLTRVTGPGTHIASTAIVALIGFGLSGGTVASNSIIQLSVPHQYVGVAMGIVTTARNVGGSVATTIYTTILTNELAKRLGVDIATALAKAGLPLAQVPGVTEAIATGNLTSPALAGVSLEILGAGAYGLKTAYSNSFKIVYLVSIAFGIIGAVCAMWTQNVGKFMTNKVDVRLDEGAHITTRGDTGGHVINHEGEEILGKSSAISTGSRFTVIV
jgi:hypothetical protein